MQYHIADTICCIRLWGTGVESPWPALEWGCTVESVFGGTPLGNYFLFRVLLLWVSDCCCSSRSAFLALRYYLDLDDPARVWAMGLWIEVAQIHPVIVSTACALIIDGFTHFRLDL